MHRAALKTLLFCALFTAGDFNRCFTGDTAKLLYFQTGVTPTTKLNRQNNINVKLNHHSNRLRFPLSRRNLSKGEGENSTSPQNQNLKGFYRRPSAALERGGGFFVPGLEGGRLQLLVALVALSLLAINRYPGYDVVPSQLTSEALGVIGAVVALVQYFLQGFYTSKVELAQQVVDEDVFELSERLEENEQLAERVVWSATSLLETTPRATLVLLLSSEGNGETEDNNAAILACIGRRRLRNKQVTTDQAATLIREVKAEGGLRVQKNTDGSNSSSISQSFPDSWKTYCAQVVGDTKMLVVLSEAYIKLGEKDQSLYTQIASLIKG